jgi:RHS repeat-associated protein
MFFLTSFDIGKAFAIKVKRKIPVSPSPNEEARKEKPTKAVEVKEKRTEHSKTFKNPDGTFSLYHYPKKIHKKGKKGDWEDIVKQDTLTTGYPASLCLYGNGSSFLDSVGTEYEGEMWVQNYTTGGNATKLDCYLLLPDLRDLIPLSGTLTDVEIVSTYVDPTPNIFTISAYAITDPWNPATLSYGSLPQVETTASGTGTWNLGTGTARTYRSIDITDLADDWFSGTKGPYGIRLSIATQGQTVNGVTGANLPVLVTKYELATEPSDPSFGGSFYSDGLTPPQLIPGRTVIVHREGSFQNTVKSWAVSAYNVLDGLPFGIDVLSVNLGVNNLSNSLTFIPMDTLPCSNNYFGSYTFPPVNGDSNNNEDIYPNNAIGIVNPSQDPYPPELNPDPPGPKSYQFVGISPTVNNLIDVTPLIATPVDYVKYPNYPTLSNFTFVIQDDDTRFNNSIREPLFDLPPVQFDYANDIGNDGETENTVAKGVSSFRAEAFNGMINPTNLNIMLNTSALSFYVHGGLTVSFSLTYNSMFDENGTDKWTTNLIQYVDFDDTTNSLTFHSSSGAYQRFNPIYDDGGLFTDEMYPPGSTNTKAFVNNNLSSDKRYELRSKTGDVSVFFRESDGMITYASTKQGGSLIYNYSQTNTDQIVSIEDGYSGRTLDFGYDQYDRLISIEDPIGRMVTLAYNAYNNITDFGNMNSVITKVKYGEFEDTNIVKQIKKIVSATDISRDGDEINIKNECDNYSTITLNRNNKTSTIVDPREAPTIFEYYDLGQVKSMTNALNEEKSYSYDSEHASNASNEISDCNGILSTFGYDENRNIESITDRSTNSTHTDFNDNGKVLTITDREGNTYTCEYSEDGSVPVKYTDAIGRETEIVYDEDKFISKTILPYNGEENVEVNYTYDENGYLNTVENPLGQITDYNYDDSGRLLKVSRDNGFKTDYIYDENDRLHQIKGTATDDSEKITTINFDEDTGNPISVTDPDDNTTTFNYDSCDNLESVTDPMDNTVSYEYDENGNVTKITDGKGNYSQTSYDLLGRIITTTDPIGKTTIYTYTTCGQLSTITDPDNNITHLYYDSVGHLTQIEDPLENSFSFTYNKEGYLTSLTDPKNASYYLEYNDVYQVTKLTNPKNAETTYEYYTFGGVKAVNNAFNQEINYEYDSDFRLKKIIDWGNRFTEYTYDNANRVTQVEDQLGRTNIFTFDGFGNLITSEDPLENVTTYEYDISNNLTALITPMEERYEYYYDDLNRVIKTKDPLGHERNYTYDEVSNLTQFENPLENITKWAYDERNQLEKATDPLENDSLYTYDDLGRLTKAKDPLLREMNYGYDDLSRLTSVTDPLSNITSYQYDDNSNLISKTRPTTTGGGSTGPQITSYTFDELDRLTKVTSPLSFETDFTYNALSMVTGVTFPDESTTSFTYDTLNRLTGTSFSDNNSISMTYDTLDRVTALTDNIHGATTFTYDLLSRMTGEEDPFDYSTTYTYDADSRLSTKTDELGTTSFTYDAASRLTDISAPDDLDYSVDYDINDRVNNEQLPNSVKINSLYDADDRPTSIVYTIDEQESMEGVARGKNDPLSLNTEFKKLRKRGNDSSGSSPSTLPNLTDFSLLLLSYSLAEASVKLKTMRDGGFTKSSYNEYVRINNDFKKKLLTESEILGISYTYNTVSNITAEEIDIGLNSYNYTYTYDNYDQLLTAINPQGTYIYTYDQRNNRLTQRIQEGEDDNTEYYTYDLEDRLTNMTLRETQSQDIIKEIDYTYNNNGDLIEKEITIGENTDTYTYSYYVGGNLKQVTLPDETTVDFTYYAGGLRAKKITDTEIISYHYSGGALSKEVHIDKVTEDLLKTIYYIPYGFKIVEGETETTYFCVTDMRGSVIALTDSTGAIVENYSYDPFGKLETNQTIYNNNLYIGSSDVLYDSDISLYYMHARYYDFEAGRFIQKDSIEGSLDNPKSQNIYTYCSNDPIGNVDPAGTKSINSVQINTSNPYVDPYPPDPTPVSPDSPPPPDPPSSPPRNCTFNCYSSSMMTSNGLPGSSCNCRPGQLMDECGYMSCQIEGPDLNNIYLDPKYGVSINVYGDSITDMTCTSLTPDSNVTELVDYKYNLQTTIDKDGKIHSNFIDKETGEIIPDAELTSTDKEIIKSFEKGINDACEWLNDTKAQIIVLKGAVKLSLVTSMLAKYGTIFFSIVGGVTPDNMYDFAFCTVIGSAIDAQMQKYANNGSYNKYDFEIGFWVTFWAKRSGILYDKETNSNGMKFKTIRNKDIEQKDFFASSSSLIDLANTIKAIAYRESNVGTNPNCKIPNLSNKAGIMGVGYNEVYDFEEEGDPGYNALYGRGLTFQKTGNGEADTGFYDAFNNIGIGVGMLFAKLTIGDTGYSYNTEGKREAPTIGQWFEALKLYGHRLENGKPHPDYWGAILSIIKDGYDPRDDVHLFTP